MRGGLECLNQRLRGDRCSKLTQTWMDAPLCWRSPFVVHNVPIGATYRSRYGPSATDGQQMPGIRIKKRDAFNNDKRRTLAMTDVRDRSMHHDVISKKRVSTSLKKQIEHVDTGVYLHYSLVQSRI